MTAERQWPIERFLGGLDELRTVLGEAAGPSAARAKEHLIAAMAARDLGNRADALGQIASAMAELATLGDQLGGVEGSMMRAVTSAFIAAMAREDRDAVERNLKLIESRAGKPRERS